MGKILKALKTASGDVPELVLQCLNEPGQEAPARAADGRKLNGRRRSAASVESIFEKSAVVRLPQRQQSHDRPGRTEEAWQEAPEIPGLADSRTQPPVRPVSFQISDSRPLLSPRREDRRAAEQYRIIRTRIFHQVAGSSITVIASPGMGDGKTVTAVNLAAALAHKSEDKVILIDADLRLSKVHERLGIAKTPGLAEVLSGACTLEEAMLRVEQLPNFYVLPAGQAEANPTELLDSSNWRALLVRLREEFRRTIVDSPPVEAVADYDLIASNCDGVVLVVRPDHTSRPLLTRALTKVKSKLIGVLINDVEDWFLWKHGSPSYYYYQGGPRGKEGPKAAKR
ncbi:MAG TPA: CpsD/CapB family tyrosine-protein kinase [Bryobacteraceae bacterium]|nr:CpsD/CapB family tyrosine-protein kinase [Bryobacteraceae bacterium]